MKKQLYLLQNQDKYFLSKHNEWVDGRDLKELFKTLHRDIALNHLFEVNAHDYQQRIHILDCDVKGRNDPIIDPDLMPPPLPKKPKAEPTGTEQTDSEQTDTEQSDAEHLSTETLTAKITGDQVVDSGVIDNGIVDDFAAPATADHNVSGREDVSMGNPQEELLVNEG